MMLRLFLISSLCAFLFACSSNDSDALKEWFDSKGIATSYDSAFVEIRPNKKDVSSGHNDSAYMVSFYAVLGNVNGMEHTLYFGLDSLSSEVWKLRADSVFYADIYGGNIPDGHKNLEATIYWLKEDSTDHDTIWLKFEKPFINFAEISIVWNDTSFVVPLPEELLKLKGNAILAAIKPNSNNSVLRFAPPSATDVPGLLRVAQKSRVIDPCDNCLHSGIGDSLNVTFEMSDDIKSTIDGRTVVFAQLVLPIQKGAEGNELGFPVPIYTYTAGIYEPYRVDTAHVTKHGHPNLIFAQNDNLVLQVTNGLRKDSLAFTLKLGNPVLKDTLFLYNISGASEKVISERPAYSRYDFGTAFDNAKLKLWLADYGKNKK